MMTSENGGPRCICGNSVISLGNICGFCTERLKKFYEERDQQRRQDRPARFMVVGAALVTGLMIWVLIWKAFQ